MAHQTAIWPPPSGVGQLVQSQRLAARLGALGIASPHMVHDDFVRYQSLWVATGVGTGAISVLGSGVRGGVIQLTTGATASSEEYLVMQAGAASPALIQNPSSEGWYVGGRFKITTVPDAQTDIYIGLINVANNRKLGFGSLGSTSTTKFTARIGTATLTSTVNLDTGWHTGELWGTGSTTLFLSIDGEAPVSGVMGGVPADCFLPIIDALNGTTAAAQTVQIDDITYIFGGN